MSLVPTDTSVIDVASRRVLGSVELDTLRRTICHDLDDNEFELFAAICRRTGLDPIARQIYAVKRWDNRQKRDVMQPQTGIDGFRVIAERSGNYGGPAPTYWCGDDGVWVDVWLSPNAPAAAKAGVYRKDFAEPVYAVAKFSSYCATTKDGSPMAMWRTMPEVMIAKCAEALAIRKAFPNDVSGVYTREEMAQQHNAAGPPLATTQQVDQIESLLKLVPQDAMPTLKAWKAEAGISMKSGEFTAEMADDVIAKLEELAVFEEGEPHLTPTGPDVPSGPPPVSPGGGEAADGAGGSLPTVADGPLSGLSSLPGEEPTTTTPPAFPEDAWSDADKPAFDRWQRRARATAKTALDADKDVHKAQWEALVYAESGGRCTSSKGLTHDECNRVQTRLMDLSAGRGRLVETDDAQFLGWKVEA